MDDEKKKIQIEVKIKYKGSGNSKERRETIKNSIEKTYTGKVEGGEYDGYDATTIVTEVTESGADVNEVEIVEGYGRSSVAGNQFMTLFTENPKSTFHRTGGHEGGHLLGLEDRYHSEFVKKPWSPSGGQYEGVSDRDYEGNIMGAEGYGVKGSQYQRVIEADSNLVTRK